MGCSTACHQIMSRLACIHECYSIVPDTLLRWSGCTDLQRLQVAEETREWPSAGTGPGSWSQRTAPSHTAAGTAAETSPDRFPERPGALQLAEGMAPPPSFLPSPPALPAFTQSQAFTDMTVPPSASHGPPLLPNSLWQASGLSSHVRRDMTPHTFPRQLCLRPPNICKLEVTGTALAMLPGGMQSCPPGSCHGTKEPAITRAMATLASSLLFPKSPACNHP